MQKLEALREQATKTQQWVNVQLLERNDDGVIMRMQLAISPSGVPMLQITSGKITNKINLPSLRHVESLIRLLNDFYSKIEEPKRQAIAEFLGKYARRGGTRVFEL